MLRLRALGADVRTFKAPYLYHQKTILIPPDIVFVGSHNLTYASVYRNFESSVRFQNFGVYQTLHLRFCRFFGAPPPPTSPL